jgi:alkylation response protein AidB-like acyl-CoA dehydrogenase
VTSTAQRFFDLVQTLGPAFRERAAASDRDGRFAAENYAALKEHRFFSAGVPQELGGGGASHQELCELLRQLSHFCSSTALALSMHTHLVALSVWRHRHGQPAEALLRKIAASELVLVSTGAGDWVDSVGGAEKVEGGYRVNAVKRFCSGGPAGDLMVTSAPCDAEVLHFPVPLRSPGVTIRDDWDTLGMRATGSHSIELKDVFVPDEAVVLKRPRGEWHPFWNAVVTMAPPIYLAPYVGAAERIADLARTAVKQKPLDPLQLLTLGELENQLTLMHLAWRSMIDITNDYDVTPSVDSANRMLVRKTLATNAALAVATKALELAGGSALYRATGIERLFRDLQGAPFHPLPEKKQLTFTGRIAAGLSPVG